MDNMATINTPSTNDFSKLSQQRTKIGGAGTNGDVGPNC
jgi:hypothetical protein